MTVQVNNSQLIDLATSQFVPRMANIHNIDTFTLKAQSALVSTVGYAYAYFLDCIAWVYFSITADEASWFNYLITIDGFSGSIQPYDYGENYVIGSWRLYRPPDLPLDPYWYMWVGVVVPVAQTEVAFAYSGNPEYFGADGLNILVPGDRIDCNLLY